MVVVGLSLQIDWPALLVLDFGRPDINRPNQCTDTANDEFSLERGDMLMVVLPCHLVSSEYRGVTTYTRSFVIAN